MKTTLLFISALCFCQITFAQHVDYSVKQVAQEADLNLTRITTDTDEVCMPIVDRDDETVNWYTNRILSVSPKGAEIGFLATKDDKTNIYVKVLDGNSTSVQRTKRQAVIDFSYSPDGQEICFTEKNGRTNSIFITSATEGFLCRQVTTGYEDYSPVFGANNNQIYFTRMEDRQASIWEHDAAHNYLYTCGSGMNPSTMNSLRLLVVRPGANGNYEVWSMNIKTGEEKLIIRDSSHSFSTPSLSPDGKWILLVGSTKLSVSGNASLGDYYCNTDIYVCRTDGSQLTQLTYHAADDLSPAWSPDGKHIYFISQRGSADAKANVWKMDFNL